MSFLFACHSSLHFTLFYMLLIFVAFLYMSFILLWTQQECPKMWHFTPRTCQHTHCTECCNGCRGTRVLISSYLDQEGHKLIFIRMTWISFGALPCRKKKTWWPRVSMLLKSCASLTWFRVCFLPGRAKDLSAPRYYSRIDGLQFDTSCPNKICALLGSYAA